SRGALRRRRGPRVAAGSSLDANRECVHAAAEDRRPPAGALDDAQAGQPLGQGAQRNLALDAREGSPEAVMDAEPEGVADVDEKVRLGGVAREEEEHAGRDHPARREHVSLLLGAGEIAEQVVRGVGTIAVEQRSEIPLERDETARRAIPSPDSIRASEYDRGD